MTSCGNCFFGGRTVGHKGDPTSPFVIIGESPGINEFRTGKPLSGPAGTLLHTVLNPLLPFIGVDPYVVSAFNCLRKQKEPPKLVAACRACHPRLLTELKAHPRKLIIALGNAALWSATGDYSLKITQVRGTLYQSPLASAGILAVAHPAFLLRGGGSLQQFKRDMIYAAEIFRDGALFPKDTADRILKNSANFEESGETHTTYAAAKYKIVTTADEVSAIVAELNSGKFDLVGADIETEGLNPYAHDIAPPTFIGEGILSLGLSYHPDMSYVIPGKLITNDIFLTPPKFCWHGGKFDIGWLREYGFWAAKVDEDTMLMSYCLNEIGGMHDLEQVAADWLKAPNYKNMLNGVLPSKKHSYAYIPKDLLYKYQAIDANITYHLGLKLRTQVNRCPKMRRVYEEILIPASEFLHKVERRGFAIDLNKVSENEMRLGSEAEKCEREFGVLAEELGGEKFRGINIRSPQQVTNILYRELKLAPVTASTDMDTLETLPNHPIVSALKKYRKVHKQLSTFVLPLRIKSEVDGRIHTSFKLHGTVTGRLSSNTPNIQNIPRDVNIRGQFIPMPGHVLLEIDLSQAELRMLACLSQDPVLVAIFQSGRSLHDDLAEYIFGKGFNKEQKMIAKNINFGIIYGITASGLLEQIESGALLLGSTLRITKKDADDWITSWYKRFEVAGKYIEKCRDAPLKGQTLISKFGRRRRFGVVSRERLNALQNEAANFPHQSGAHDITLLSGIETQPILMQKWNAHIVNEVHDSLVIETPDDMHIIIPATIQVMDTMKDVAHRWGLTQVPFVTEAELGYAWGNGTKFDPYELLPQVESLKGVTYVEFAKRF